MICKAGCLRTAPTRFASFSRRSRLGSYHVFDNLCAKHTCGGLFFPPLLAYTKMTHKDKNACKKLYIGWTPVQYSLQAVRQAC